MNHSMLIILFVVLMISTSCIESTIAGAAIKSTADAFVPITQDVPLADLSLELVMWSPQNPRVGDIVTFDALISNLGNAPSKEGLTHIMLENTIYTVETPSIPASGQLRLSTLDSITFQHTRAGKLSFVLSVDYLDNTPESNERNNVERRIIDIQPILWGEYME